MKRTGLFLSVLCFCAVFLCCCNIGVPYLYVAAMGSYPAGPVLISYSFRAEEDVHEAHCRLEYLADTGSGNHVFITEDEKTLELRREGTVTVYAPRSGICRMTLTLLSSRGTLRNRLEFLSESVEFEVTE